MTADETNKVIDKIAEKVGVAVEKVEPIAQEVIQQVQNRALAQIICSIFFIVLILIFIPMLEKKVSDDFNDLPSVFGYSLIAIMSIPVADGILTYVAPLASILGV